MKQYIVSIIVVSIIGSVISILTPEGEGGGLARHTRLIFGVCVIVVCFSPLKDAIVWIRELDIESILPDSEQNGSEYESIFENTYDKAQIDNLKEGIKGVLKDRFGLDPLCVDVSVSLRQEGDDQRLERVAVTLYDSAIWADTEEIESYLCSLLGCEIITVIG
ncbi:MAG: hypothetical protein E7649_06855 [Ruminococcaceae bacterium]|nr:hypothetical protein [Oscillospiraceae bacterium]